MLFRSRKKLGKEISLYEPIGNDPDGNEIRLLDILESEQEDPVQTLDLKKNVRFLYEQGKQALTKREWNILCLRYGLGRFQAHTQREIAAKLGISRSYVSRIEKKALCKLKDCYTSAGFKD
jgi:RNA polymerase sporulation-specific sigma factor